MVTVVNKKKHIPTAYDFYIGRGSVMGNPYSWGNSSKKSAARYFVSGREEAVKKYAPWLLDKLADTTSPQYEEFRRMVKAASRHDIYLVCYCAPEPCEGDLIKKLIENLLFP